MKQIFIMLRFMMRRINLKQERHLLHKRLVLELPLIIFNKHISFDELQKHEAALCAQLIDGLVPYKKITILGPIEQLKKSGHLVSFAIDGIHAHDVAAHLSNYGICVRAGHHCAQPLAKKLELAQVFEQVFMCIILTKKLRNSWK